MSKGSRRGRRLALRASAKVNLALEVLSKRADGYHEIATVLQTVDLADRVILEEADTLQVCAGVPGVPEDGSNLALRAAHALRAAAGVERGVRITLDKRIPVAAGLGGGSADAAAVLVGLNRLWGLRWPRARLQELAIGLGMDVPFFLRGGAALGTGRGEVLTPLPARSLALVLVVPRRPSSTREAYAHVTPDHWGDGRRVKALAEALQRGTLREVAARLYNGLERVVVPRYPEVERARAAVLAAGGLGAVMSGSGPTVVGVARSREHARALQARLSHGPWWCRAARSLRGPAVRITG